VFIKWKIQTPFPVECSLQRRDGEHSLHLAPLILQASSWEGCALVQIQHKLIVFYVPGSSCHSSKGECRGLGLI